MPERTPLSHREQQPDSFEPETISDALKAHPEPIEDVYGDGLRWRFGLGERTSLEVFPDTTIARIAFPDAQLLFRANSPKIEDGEVVFESQRDNAITRVIVTPESGVAIALATYGKKDAQIPAASLEESTDSSLADSTQTSLVGDSAAKERPSKTPATPEKERAQRFTGIVAAKPWFKTRESDQKFIAGFALGIGEVGKRQWVDVYVTEDRARELQQQVAEGLIGKKSDVVVVGFPKEQTVMKDGKEHTRRWINAVAIKPKLLSES
jgi:hypothetical protein